MKKHLLSFFLLAILWASSCSQEEIVQQQVTHAFKSEFIASFEQTDSRTYLEDGKYLRWTADDELSIFMGTTLNRQFRFTGDTGDNSGEFEEASSPGFVTGNNLDNPCHYAVYPYNKKTKISETGILTINMPSQQTYAANSFGLGNNTMVAVTSSLSDMNLAFKNACGYLKLKFYGNDVTVKSIVLQSNGGEKLSGTATLTAAYGKNPSVSMSSTASDMITLDCGDTGVKIGSTKEEATEFWFVVPETSFSQGFTLTVTDIDGNCFEKTTSKNIVVERNVIKPISAIEVVIDNSTYKDGVVRMVEAGTMKKLLGKGYLDITSLKVVGPINGDDVYYLRKMLGGGNFSQADWGKLTTLDLSKATIEEGGDWYYEYYSSKYYTSMVVHP